MNENNMTLGFGPGSMVPNNGHVGLIAPPTSSASQLCYVIWWEESPDVGGVGFLGVYRSAQLARHLYERLQLIAGDRKVHMAEQVLL